MAEHGELSAQQSEPIVDGDNYDYDQDGTIGPDEWDAASTTKCAYKDTSSSTHLFQRCVNQQVTRDGGQDIVHCGDAW